jgi:hypothetical protein
MTSRLGNTTGVTLMDDKVITREEFESRNTLKTNLKIPIDYKNNYEFFINADLDSIIYHIQNLEFLKDKVNFIEGASKCLSGKSRKTRFLCINPDKNAYKFNDRWMAHYIVTLSVACNIK